VLKIASLKQLK